VVPSTEPSAEAHPPTSQERSRILIVEDDVSLRTMLETILDDEGFEVEGHSSGEVALERLDSLDPDLIVADVGLPGMDGFDLVRAVRERSTVAVVMLTARTDSADVVAGLGAGADDYVVKPFVVEELLARIRANLRRAPGGPEPLGVISVGELRVDPRTGEVSVRGEPVHLTRTELRVLMVLAAADGAIVSREQLLARVWRYDYLGDSRMVDAQIRRLRLKIERDPAAPEILLTVRGAGYRVVAPSSATEDSSAGATSET
jgi:DNA-binding response OmpR family regulator